MCFYRVSQPLQQTVSLLKSARAHQEDTPPHRGELKPRGGAVTTKSPLHHTPMYVILCGLGLIFGGGKKANNLIKIPLLCC